MGALKRGGGGLEPPYELWLDENVDHNMFIKKLDHDGVRWVAKDWFMSK